VSGTQSTDVVFNVPNAYADMSDAATKESFFDGLLARQVQQFGDMTYVYATSQSHKNQNDPKSVVRAIKSFELLSRGGRWYITQVPGIGSTRTTDFP
jgi:hypothetical protein